MGTDTSNGLNSFDDYMRAKIRKLEEQFVTGSDPFRKSNLFNGISIFVNGRTNPSADELKRLMMVHGGIFHHYERSHTTFIIASNLPDVKVRNMNTSKVLSAQWVLECIKENRIIDHKKYLLYTNHKPSQPKLLFQKNVESVVKGNVNDANLDDQVSSENPNVFNEKIPESNLLEINEQDSKIDIDTDDGKLSATKLDQPNFDKQSELCSNNEEHEISTKTKDASALNKYRTRSAVDPNFLSDFYNNSRLHHIATLGATFKQYIAELREKHDGKFPAREDIRNKIAQKLNFVACEKAIMHIDMDCFFVSVGLRSRPELRGQPIAVTHSKGGSSTARPGVDRRLEMSLYLKRFDENLAENVKKDKMKHAFDTSDSMSEIASCSYEARQCGIKNGMFVGQAMKLCPNLQTIPYDFDGYKEVAYTLYETICQYTLDIEAVSCDEMFVDLSDVINDLEADTMQFVKHIRDQVKEKTRCPCSAGVGNNRLQARMATKKAKPDGQYLLYLTNVEEYMKPIQISDLPGVGYSTNYTLKQLNWNTCGDLQEVSLVRIQKELGTKFGETLYNFCRGIDNRPLVYGQVRKSVSAEVNYGIRFTQFEELERFLHQLCSEVHSRLMEIKRRGKCITFKAMVRAKDAPVESSKFMGHGFCDNLTKSLSLSDYTCDLNVITKNILSIVKSLNIPAKEYRGIGIQISKLDTPNEKPKENVIKNMFSKVAQARKPEPMMDSNVSKLDTEVALLKKSPERRKKSSETELRRSTREKQSKKIASFPSKTSNVVKMLQKANSNKSIPAPTSNSVQDIDISVLAELPEDIRAEVLRDHKLLSNTYNKKRESDELSSSRTESDGKKFKADEDFLAALPLDLRKEVETQIKQQNEKRIITKCSKKSSPQKSAPTDCTLEMKTNQPQRNIGASSSRCEQQSTVRQIKQISSDNIIAQKEWRPLLQAWVNSMDSPEEYDVNVLAESMTEFIGAKRIHDLYVPLTFLYRVINEKKNCAWHQAYKVIHDRVQSDMITYYGARMFIKEAIECPNCH